MLAYAYKSYLVTFLGNILVCNKCFNDTFQISIGRISRILKAHENIPKYMCGKTDGSCRRTTELMMTHIVIEDIKSFPVFECDFAQLVSEDIK